jgi:hypothetical protein
VSALGPVEVQARLSGAGARCEALAHPTSTELEEAITAATEVGGGVHVFGATARSSSGSGAATWVCTW